MDKLELLTGRSEKDLLAIITDIEKYYISYKVRKTDKKKFRWIDAPTSELKLIQRNLIRNFFSKVAIHSSAHGFVENKSSVTNAEQHLGNNILLSVDIEDFFPSITMGNILRAIIAAMNASKIFLSKRELRILTRLVSFKKHLPQGAPTSPIISNILFRSIDFKFASVFSKDNIVYTRYADDITLSHKNTTYNFLNSVNLIETVLRTLGLKLNRRKTKVIKQNRRMLVTGVVINNKLGTPRYYWRNLRAELHNLYKNNVEINKQKWSELNGKISWIYSLNPTRGKELQNSLSKIQLIN